MRKHLPSIINSELENIVLDLERKLGWCSTPKEETRWRISHSTDCLNPNCEKLNVEFFNHHGQAEKIMSTIIEKAQRTPIFRNDEMDMIGPLLRPIMRCSIAMSRKSRVALDSTIKNIDADLRRNYHRYISFRLSVGQYENLRMFEEWEDNCDTGMVGVEGWMPNGFERISEEKLLPLLRTTDVSMEDFPELNSKVGLIFVNSLPRKYNGKVVVDVDKLEKKIHLLGDKANAALEDLKTFPSRKNETYVATDISLKFPHFNNELSFYLSPSIIENIIEILCLSRLSLDLEARLLQFEGSILAMDFLTNFLEQISDIIFKEAFASRRQVGNGTRCPVCTEDYLEPVVYECGHSICLKCFHSSVKTSTSMSMKCAKVDCNGYMTPKDLMKLILGHEEQIHHLDFTKLKSLFLKTTDETLMENISKKPCQQGGCPGLWFKEDKRDPTLERCTECYRKYCSGCLGNPHGQHPCPNVDENKSFAAWMSRYQC